MKEKKMDPEDISRVKKPVKSDSSLTYSGEKFHELGGNLDVPGSDLDDELENVGNEDEENNYYNIGGDDHENLDEDKDEL